MSDGWKQHIRSLKLEVYALYLAIRDPRTPWYARVLAGCVVAYALSPIDLIPDPIPLLGQLDDLVLIPLGVMAVRRLVPPLVLAECRRKAELNGDKSINTPGQWVAAAIIVGVWIISVALLVRLIWFAATR